MKTYKSIYNDNYVKRVCLIAAHDQAEAESLAYESECGYLTNGTPFYPNAEDFFVTEIKGVFSRVKEAGIVECI